MASITRVNLIQYSVLIKCISDVEISLGSPLEPWALLNECSISHPGGMDTYDKWHVKEHRWHVRYTGALTYIIYNVSLRVIIAFWIAYKNWTFLCGWPKNLNHLQFNLYKCHSPIIHLISLNKSGDSTIWPKQRTKDIFNYMSNYIYLYDFILQLLLHTLH